MSTNKNAILRYNTLDRCFSDFTRKYYFKDLQDKINTALSELNLATDGIQDRQLRDDISFMRSETGYSAPIETIRDGKKAYYRYSDRNFSINKSPLNKFEAELLKNALSVIQRFEGLPQFEWLNELTPMLSSQFGLKDNNKKVMSYDSNIDYLGYDKIQPIFNAIINQRVLKVNYAPFNKKAYVLHFHPYYLKQYNSRWFVFGLDKLFNVFTWNLALDRIINVKETDDQYIETDIDWEDYFYDIIGVSTPRNAKVETIELLFTAEQANYIKTKPLHPSQKSKMLNNGMLQVKLNLIPNYELEMTLLSFGEKVKVLSPTYLRERIKQRLAKAINEYN